MGYPLLKETSNIFEALDNRSIENPGLVFNRFVNSYDTRGEWKKEGLEQVLDIKGDSQLLKSHIARWERVVNSARANRFSMKTSWRFITGLGAKGPYEVGFTFDRYGFPYLPGSSVKGIARAGAILIGDMQESDPEFKTIFGDAADSGSAGQSGKAVFFDAVPATMPTLKLDVMNPHHSKYYSGENPYPVTWEDPIPIFFLTVGDKQEFLFAVGWRGASEDRELRTKAEAWLKDGLMELGAGAKTGAGYGYWDEVTKAK